MPSVYSGTPLPSHFGNTRFPVALMGGTLTLMQNQEVLNEYMPFWGIGKVGSWRVCICTLLGPEGPEQLGLRPGWTVPLDLFSVTSFVAG